MRKLFVVFVLLVLAPVLKSQEYLQADSLSMLYLTGNYSALQHIVQKNIRDGKYLKKSWFFLGKTYENKYRYDSALYCYQQALKEDAVDILLLNNLASAYVSNRMFSKAVPVYKDILTISPQDIGAKVNLANIYLKMNNELPAKNIYLDLIQQDTSNAYFYSQLAACYQDLNNTDSAQYCLEAAVSINPSDYYSVTKLSTIYIKKNMPSSGLQITSDYLKSDSSNLAILKLYGYFNLLMDYADSALAVFNKAYLMGDSSFMTMKYSGISNYKLGNLAKASEFLEKAYFTDTADVENLFYLGISLGWTYDKAGGIFYLQKILDIAFPDSKYVARIYKEIGDLYEGWYRPQQALDYYQKALENDPGETLLLFRLGRIYEDIDKQKALEYFERFLQTRKPGDPGDVPADETMKEGNTLSPYDIAEKKIKTLREELFFNGIYQKQK